MAQRRTFKEIRDEFVTNLEDKRQLKGLRKREAAKAAALAAAPGPIVQTTPRNVELPQARPSVSEPVLAGENPPVTIVPPVTCHW